ncbi:Uncharacterised protein [uncultured archaeon]|nr:Uncharacterised protein [uncultured archaeon]
MKIIFTNHAKVKFKILERHGFKITEDHIKETVENPASKTHGRKDRLIMQRPFDDTHMLRVICEVESNDNVKVIMFYPARRDRYEN